MGLAVIWNSSLQWVHEWAMYIMYILGLCSSWGTSRICPAWSPSEHQLAPALSPLGAPVRSHAVGRRLFKVLMTAAHISPNVFSLWKFLSNIQGLFLTVHSNISHTYYTSHLYAHLHLLFYTSCSHIHFFGSSWQAGCPRLLVSDTVMILVNNGHRIHYLLFSK
jgi:hypothetical protein